MDSKKAIIIGEGSALFMVKEMLERNGVVIFGVLTDDQIEFIGEVPVVGKTTDETYLKLFKSDSQLVPVVASKDVDFRKQHMTALAKEFSKKAFPLIDSSVWISKDALIGAGLTIMPNSSIFPKVKFGDGAWVGAGAIVQQHVETGKYITIESGAIIGERAYLASEAYVGSGAILAAGVKIGKKANIGAGSVVLRDVEEGATVFGNPAKSLE